MARNDVARAGQGGDGRGGPDPDRDPARGRFARNPLDIPALGWRDIILRLFVKFNEDRTMLIAGGVTFYLLLALFASIAAFVSIFGLVTDPAVIHREIAALEGIVPDAWLEIVGRQLTELAAQPQATLGISLAISLGVTFWTANNGVKAIFEALNVAYTEQEKRGIVELHLQSLAFTIGGMVLTVVLVAAIGLIPALLAFLQVGEVADRVVRTVRWMVIVPVLGVVVALFYRFGPSRVPASWSWITWGSTLATAVWLLVSIGYSVYLQRFADYQAVYGSLGALVGLLLWVWLSVLILIVGAQFNAEMELQTRKDTTRPPEQPIGQRGAFVADTVGPPAGRKEA